ncbi:MAG: Na+/H+ antiporter subunit E [Gammaproteobacteria bacterium]|nr:Na+/H+ antiporter subunit E [Gammaproteobacteria bacterium]
MKANKITTYGVSIVMRLAMFLFIWWALTAGITSSWWFGAPAILLALISSLVLLPPMNLLWYECLRFIPFFLIRSLIGGIDVAWRAFHPRMPITPDLIEYPLTLPAGQSQVFMANTINLLPGTLSAALDRNTIKVHVLDSQKDFFGELEAVEQHVARIFGLSLNIPSKDKYNETL